jgi:probable rRNA maturation factor
LKAVINTDCSFEIDVKTLRKACLKALRAEGVRRDALLSLSAVNKERIEELNRKYLGEEIPTDVIAFPMQEECEEGYLLGDVVICPEVILEERNQYKVEEGRELEFVAVHGVLHLLGYEDDQAEGSARMDRRQRRILGMTGERRP